MYSPAKKLELLKDKLVEQVVFDVLHMKWELLENMNTGQHEDYIKIVKELKRRYKQQLKTNNQ